MTQMHSFFTCHALDCRLCDMLVKQYEHQVLMDEAQAPLLEEEAP